MCRDLTPGHAALHDARLLDEECQVIKPLCAVGFAGCRRMLTRRAGDRADAADGLGSDSRGLAAVEDRDQRQGCLSSPALPVLLPPPLHLTTGLAELIHGQAVRAARRVYRDDDERDAGAAQC